jgi:hypothetical protein
LYDSIDVLPVWNWNQIHETGNLKHLMIDGKQDTPPGLQKLWLKLNQQYMDEFGISSKYRDYLRLIEEGNRPS